MLALTGMGVLAAGCSGGQPFASRSSARPSATPSAVTSPCASVHATTLITDVPDACAELWAPYQVTMVPPPDILEQEHVPPAPKVVNKTNGAVSDAEAQRWADASNRDSGWYKWAYAYDQPGLLSRLVGTPLIPRADMAALADGATISVPDCDLYPTSYTLFANSETGRAYFQRKGLPSTDGFVFVVRFSGPCNVTTQFPDGRVESRTAFDGPSFVFQPGEYRDDPLLGSLWFEDAGGNCNDSVGPPRDWCGR